jgi:hypothetical protein
MCLPSIGLTAGKGPVPGARTLKAKWTVLIYMAADNSLHDDAELNLTQAIKIGSRADLNVLAYRATVSAAQGQAKVGQRLVIYNDGIVIAGQDLQPDSGDVETFTNAVLWAISCYPSEHLAVVVWDHGMGDLNLVIRALCPERGVCIDDTYHTYLDDAKLMDAFNRIVTARGGKKLDMVIFDACMMAGTGTAHIVSQFADYMVASETIVPGLGYNYETMLSAFATGSDDCRDIAQAIVASYQAFYAPQIPAYTNSAFNLSAFPELAQNIDTVAHLLVEGLAQQKDGTIQEMIRASHDPQLCVHFDEPSYIDLYSFYTNLLLCLDHVELVDQEQTEAFRRVMQETLEDGQRAIFHAIFSNVYGDAFQGAGGVSIYFPVEGADIHASYPATEFGKHNFWLQFLQMYKSMPNQAPQVV